MVTKLQAEKVFKNFKAKYKNTYAIEEAVLIKNWEMLGYSNGQTVKYPAVPYAIIWEAGPSEWTYWQQSIEVPGVYVEAYTTWALAINEE